MRGTAFSTMVVSGFFWLAFTVAANAASVTATGCLEKGDGKGEFKLSTLMARPQVRVFDVRSTTQMSICPTLPGRADEKNSRLSFWLMAGPKSGPGLLTSGPALTAGPNALSTMRLLATQMSKSPSPSGLDESQYSVLPFAEMLGWPSKYSVLTVGPRFRGVPHGSSMESRVVAYRSASPKPPGRLDEK